MHLDLGPHDSRIARSVFRVERSLRQSVPNITLKVDPTVTPDSLVEAGVRTVHFVSPSFWAWRAKKLANLKRAADHVLCIFPFEPELLQRHEVPVHLPLADVVAAQAGDEVPSPCISVCQMNADTGLCQGCLLNCSSFNTDAYFNVGPAGAAPPAKAAAKPAAKPAAAPAAKPAAKVKTIVVKPPARKTADGAKVVAGRAPARQAAPARKTAGAEPARKTAARKTAVRKPAGRG